MIRREKKTYYFFIPDFPFLVLLYFTLNANITAEACPKEKAPFAGVEAFTYLLVCGYLSMPSFLARLFR